MKKIMLKSATVIIAVYLGFALPANAQWTTSGTNIRNSNTGNVGINTLTVTPSKRLQVHSATSRDQMYISGTTPSIFLGDNTSIASATKMGTISMTTEANMFGFGTASGDLVMSSKTGKLHFITGGSATTSGKVRMSIGTDKVSVGTSVDAFGLEVVGTSSNCLKLKVGSDSLLLNPTRIESNKTLSINSTSMRDISLCPFSGNVGIGKGNPTARLDVVGNIKVGDNGLNSITLDGQKIESTSSLLINSVSKKNIGIGTGTVVPTSSLQIHGMGNDGTNAVLKLISGTETMLLDGNEIDGLTSLYLNHNSQKNVIMCTNGGNVGIGTSSPASTLQIEGIENDGTDAALKLVSGSQAMLLDGNEIDAVSDGLYLNRNSNLKVIMCQSGGSVGIGTSTPSSDFKLSVNGGIRAKEITVETAWSDFVFKNGYKLKSLQEVEQFISQNGHLPEIPSAEEVAQNGVKLGEVESKLLMKIEELTLYMIDMDKAVKKLTAENEELKRKVNE